MNYTVIPVAYLSKRKMQTKETMVENELSTLDLPSRLVSVLKTFIFLEYYLNISIIIWFLTSSSRQNKEARWQLTNRT
jgi:hypothetical protein